MNVLSKNSTKLFGKATLAAAALGGFFTATTAARQITGATNCAKSGSAAGASTANMNGGNTSVTTSTATIAIEIRIEP